MCSKHSNNVLAVCVALLVLAAGAAPGQEAVSAPVPAAVVEAPDVVVLPEGDLEAAPDVDLAPDIETVDPETLPPAGAGVSEAEEYFRRGVTLYKEGLYREALTEFNRALALEPDLAEALTYREKASARLQLTATGEDLTTVPNFEVFDEEAFAPGTQPALSPQELQRARVRELMEMAARYMEYQRWATAVEIYNEVLLIDPKNEAARDGLHQATIGVGQKSIEESQRELAEDRQRIREETEKKKLLPPGAGPDGIKPIRVQLPTIEEQYDQEVELSETEKTLQSPVSIEFEDIHISEIVEFISDSYDINIVIDNRVVAPPPQVLAAAQPAGPGTFPGAPGVPGAVPGAFPPGRPGVPGAPGARPGVPGAFPNANNPNLNRPGFTQQGQNEQLYGQFRTDGNVPYINLTGVTLEEALRALLRPLGLDFAVQPGFIWISTPQIIREESFEKLETRFYELRNAGQQTLYKIVLRNAFGVVGGGGGFGGGRGGGFGGGGFGGNQGGFGGGGFGGNQGGFGGGGFGGNQGGFGGGGFGGNQGGVGGGGFGGNQGGVGGGGFGGT
ncbi:MAG: tetratricopeptide repeat protein, partial [Candidatus Hydrogenedentes bacterium]|nr:tetratricopeptide repeat protein [Candidatus Hydrogenedentota bacterium]